MEKIILPFVSWERQELKLRNDHPVLAIYNGFHGQTTKAISAENNIITIQIPANSIDKLQSLDVTINKPMKD